MRDKVSRGSQANSEMEDMESEHGQEQVEETGLSLILKELREFRKDNNQQLKEICEEITNGRMEEAEKRIDTAETRIQGAEEAITELLKLQIHLDAKLTDLEDRSRRENIRIHGVKEGAEDNSTSMVGYVEHLLREGLDLLVSFALTPKPPPGALPRSIVAKLQDERGVIEAGLAKEGISASREKCKSGSRLCSRCVKKMKGIC